jgi:PAS domain S-box-containing protein
MTTASIPPERLRATADLAGLTSGFEALFEAAPSPFLVVTSPDYMIIAVNDEYLRATMTERAAIVGRPLFEVFPDNPDVPTASGPPELRASLARVVAGRCTDDMPVVRYDIRRPSALGGGFEEHWWKPRNAPVLGTDGEVVCIIHHVVDVTARVRAETALREREAKYRAIVENAGEGITISSTNGLITFVNKQMAEMLGYEVDEMLGRPSVDFTFPDWENRVHEANVQVRENGTLEGDFKLRRKDGSPLWTHFTGVRLIDEQGEHVANLALHTDISGRRRAELALRESEDRQTFLLKLSDALRPLADPAAVQTTAMRLLAERLDVMRASYFELEEDGDTFHLAARFERDATPMPERMRLSDFSPALAAAYRSGRTLMVPDTSVLGEFVEDPAPYAAIGVGAWVAVPLMRDGRLMAWIGVHSGAKREWSAADLQALNDVAERTWGAAERARAEAALRESEVKFRAVFETMIEACCIFELIYNDLGQPVDWKILEANPGYEKQSGLKDVAGKLASEVMPGTEPYWIETFGRVVETGEAEQIEKWHQPTGRWIHSSTARVGGSGSRRLASVFYDITQRKRAEQVLRESEERQAFLLKLSDALRAEPDEDSIATVAVELTAAQMRVARCWIAVLIPDENRAVVAHSHRRPDLQSMNGEYRYSDFPKTARQIETGTLALDDIQSDSSLSDKDKAGFSALRIGAQLAACLRKGDGRVMWSLTVADEAPRKWTREEVALLEEAAERTWAALEHARIEAEIRESEGRLRAAVEEREALLKELHHRVKNNLQVITSLLEMQARQAPDTPAPASLSDARNRITAIANIHELLYQSGSYSDVDLGRYARRLVQHVVSLYDPESRIDASVSGDGVRMELVRAVPFGLLLNELVSNAYKHAFPSGARGEVRIALDADDGFMRLRVSDTGVGLPAAFHERPSTSLGLQLVSMLAKQLSGRVTFESNGGTIVSLLLPTDINIRGVERHGDPTMHG